MALHPKKRLKKPELPEFLVLVLVGLAIIPATYWWRANLLPKYKEAEGYVLDCDIKLTHYNAPDVRKKVDITYEYNVGPGRYVGSWSGYWPQIQSPNALAPDKIDTLRDKGRRITVLYDPGNPAHSLLHYPDQGLARITGIAAIAALGAAILYCCAIYPAWRGRW